MTIYLDPPHLGYMYITALGYVSQLASGVFVVEPGAVAACTTRVGSFSTLRGKILVF